MDRYAEQVYAGVLGKIIGVYLGRPIEGWPYQKIKDTFGTICYYIHKQINVPLIVADDDISGTFTFFNAVEDFENIHEITAENIGTTWLNYLIEDKTILWWGGLGRSTEHTAYLNLKKGIKAPESGSIAMNGQTVAEQIGAQIFMDCYAMMCPGDPEKACYFVRQAASVSHDGIAVEAAGFLGAMESIAFVEKRIDKIIDQALNFVKSGYLKRIVGDVRNICSQYSDWRIVREWLNEHYGYQKFQGNCHIIPNHALIIAALLLSEDDFQKALQIAVSAGWDTDCNAGNIGCLNGIRLGLDSINKGKDLRKDVADRLYIVSADGGNCVSDAVQQTRRIVRAAAKLKNIKYAGNEKRFGFEFRESVQGFSACPFINTSDRNIKVSNVNKISETNGLVIECQLSEGQTAGVSTLVFWDRDDQLENYYLAGSPTLYSGQTVYAGLECNEHDGPLVRLYIIHYDFNDQYVCKRSQSVKLKKNKLSDLQWEIPDTDGMPVLRIGIEIIADGKLWNGKVILRDLDWNGAPRCFEQKGSLRNYDLKCWNMAMKSWMSSAEQFSFDSNATYCISHNTTNGIVTIGTRQWDNYSVTSTVLFSIHDRGGIVVRSRGHRRYYAGILFGGNIAAIILRQDTREIILAASKFLYSVDTKYEIKMECTGNILTMSIDGQKIVVTTDEKNTYSSGAAGFLVDTGTFLAYDFTVKSMSEEQ